MKTKIIISIMIALMLSSIASAAIDYNLPVLAPAGSGGILTSMIAKPSLTTPDYIDILITGTGAGPIVAYKNGVKLGTMTITNTGGWTRVDDFRLGAGEWNFSLDDGTKVLSRMIYVGVPEPTATAGVPVPIIHVDCATGLPLADGTCPTAAPTAAPPVQTPPTTNNNRSTLLFISSGMLLILGISRFMKNK